MAKNRITKPKPFVKQFMKDLDALVASVQKSGWPKPKPKPYITIAELKKICKEQCYQLPTDILQAAAKIARERRKK